MKRIALYPGTFDPVTNGHLDIIYRASSLCDVLIIGVAENIGKNPFFNISKGNLLLKRQLTVMLLNLKGNWERYRLKILITYLLILPDLTQ